MPDTQTLPDPNIENLDAAKVRKIAKDFQDQRKRKVEAKDAPYWFEMTGPSDMRKVVKKTYYDGKLYTDFVSMYPSKKNANAMAKRAKCEEVIKNEHFAGYDQRTKALVERLKNR